MSISSSFHSAVVTETRYDALRRETARIDGRGNVTRTRYDAQGRVSSTIDALGYATAYGYDALGRQVSVTDPLTNTVTTAYDPECHVISQRGATYPVDYSYDEFGSLTNETVRSDDALVVVTNTISQYDYAYDAGGRRIQIVRSGSAMSGNCTIEIGYAVGDPYNPLMKSSDYNGYVGGSEYGRIWDSEPGIRAPDGPVIILLR